MAPSSARYVSREEFWPVKEGLERVTVRLEVLTQDLHRMGTRSDERFDAIDQRFEAIDQRFEAIDQRFEAIDQRFDRLEKRFDDFQIETRAEFRRLDERITSEVRALDEHLRASHAELKKLIEDGHAALVSALQKFATAR